MLLLYRNDMQQLRFVYLVKGNKVNGEWCDVTNDAVYTPNLTYVANIAYVQTRHVGTKEYRGTSKDISRQKNRQKKKYPLPEDNNKLQVIL